jgi:hypothetical protein
MDSNSSTSRRRVLTAALGAAAAGVVHAVGAPGPDQAAGDDGTNLQLGGFYPDVRSQTTWANGNNNEVVLYVASNWDGQYPWNNGSGIAVWGVSHGSYGILGYSTSASGVRGEGGACGVSGLATGPGTGAGVIGTSPSGAGVQGHSTSGPGVHGYSDNQDGVHGNAYGGNGVLGTTYSGSGVEGTASGPSARGVLGVANGGGNGVTGFSAASDAVALPAVPPKTGVLGVAAEDSSSRGVVGLSTLGTGVHGWVGSGAAASPSAKTGVYGRCDTDATSRGVSGFSTVGHGVYAGTVSGHGVHAVATGTSGTGVATSSSGTTGKALSASATGSSGIGLSASASGATGTALSGTATISSGYALKTSGRLAFSKVSGVAILSAGNTSVTVTPGTDVTTSSYVLVTPQGDPGSRRIWATVNGTTNQIVIHANTTAASDLRLAWLLIG